MFIIHAFSATVNVITDYIVSFFTGILGVVLWVFVKIWSALWHFTGSILSGFLAAHPVIQGFFAIMCFLALLMIVVGGIFYLFSYAIPIVIGIVIISVLCYVLPGIMHFIVGALLLFLLWFLVVLVYHKIRLTFKKSDANQTRHETGK